MPSMAVVARTTHAGLEYLVTGRGKPDWGPAALDAKTFPNVREATRAALTLPGYLRAFALPVSPGA